MTRFFVYLSLVVCLSVIVLFFQDGVGRVDTLTDGVLIGFAIPLIDAALSNLLRLRFLWGAAIHPRASLRISASYLFRIKVDDNYLLIKSDRYQQYGPVGGVYKYYPSAKTALDDFGMVSDNYLPMDARTSSDLRILIKFRKVFQFVNWFESEKSREVDAWREFQEELILTGILSAGDFPSIGYERVRRIYRKIRTNNLGDKELLIADIYSIVLNTSQEAAIRALDGANESRILWAKEPQIKALGAVPGAGRPVVIGEPAVWTL